MKVNATIGVLGITIMLLGCVNNAPMGYHVMKLKSEQTYNPNATLQNREVIPDGTGERMEGAYRVYTGKGDNLPSQVLGGY